MFTASASLHSSEIQARIPPTMKMSSSAALRIENVSCEGLFTVSDSQLLPIALVEYSPSPPMKYFHPGMNHTLDSASGSPLSLTAVAVLPDISSNALPCGRASTFDATASISSSPVFRFVAPQMSWIGKFVPLDRCVHAPLE